MRFEVKSTSTAGEPLSLGHVEVKGGDLFFETNGGQRVSFGKTESIVNLIDALHLGLIEMRKQQEAGESG